MMTRPIDVTVWLLTLLGTCYSVALDEPCNDADTCTTLGQSCLREYGNCVHYGFCIWTNKYNTEACVDNGQCQGGTTCTSSTCSCPSGTYNTVLKLCTALKEYGQACTASTECYQGGTGGNAECSSNVCACKSGYIKDAGINQCRAPYVSEACSAGGAPPCQSQSHPANGIVLETCSADVCTCPAGSTSKTISKIGISVCFTDVTMLADGVACTTHNQCNYGYCSACPGTASTICVTAAGVTTQPPGTAAGVAGMPVIGLMTIVSMVTVVMTLVL